MQRVMTLSILMKQKQSKLMKTRKVILKGKRTNEKAISNTKRQELEKKVLTSFTKLQAIQHLDPTLFTTSAPA